MWNKIEWPKYNRRAEMLTCSEQAAGIKITVAPPLDWHHHTFYCTCPPPNNGSLIYQTVEEITSACHKKNTCLLEWHCIQCLRLRKNRSVLFVYPSSSSSLLTDDSSHSCEMNHNPEPGGQSQIVRIYHSSCFSKQQPRLSGQCLCLLTSASSSNTGLLSFSWRTLSMLVAEIQLHSSIHDISPSGLLFVLFESTHAN